MKWNLISLGSLDAIGCGIKAQDGAMKVMKGSLLMIKGVWRNGLYVLQGKIMTGVATTVTKKELKRVELWHLRLGHIGKKGPYELSKQTLLGAEKTTRLEFYEHCVYGKSRRMKFSIRIHNTKGILDYVHSNLYGPTSIDSQRG